jgi:hypothetical protein
MKKIHEKKYGLSGKGIQRGELEGTHTLKSDKNNVSCEKDSKKTFIFYHNFIN